MLITANTWVLLRQRQYHMACYGTEQAMIVLGIILLVVGYIVHIGILETIGIVLIVIGAVLWLLGAIGRPVGGRKVWF
jgi:hypothetical protein